MTDELSVADLELCGDQIDAWLSECSQATFDKFNGRFRRFYEAARKGIEADCPTCYGKGTVHRGLFTYPCQNSVHRSHRSPSPTGDAAEPRDIGDAKNATPEDAKYFPESDAQTAQSEERENMPKETDGIVSGLDFDAKLEWHGGMGAEFLKARDITDTAESPFAPVQPPKPVTIEELDGLYAGPRSTQPPKARPRLREKGDG